MLIHGKDGVIKKSGQVVAEITNWTLTRSVPTELGNAQGDTGPRRVAGIPDWSVTITANHDPAEHDGFDEGDSVTLDLYPGGEVAGRDRYSGIGLVQSAGVTSGGEAGKVATQLTIEGNSPLAKTPVGGSS